jgi:hypothetical protein
MDYESEPELPETCHWCAEPFVAREQGDDDDGKLYCSKCGAGYFLCDGPCNEWKPDTESMAEIKHCDDCWQNKWARY